MKINNFNHNKTRNIDSPNNKNSKGQAAVNHTDLSLIHLLNNLRHFHITHTAFHQEQLSPGTLSDLLTLAKRYSLQEKGINAYNAFSVVFSLKTITILSRERKNIVVNFSNNRKNRRLVQAIDRQVRKLYLDVTSTSLLMLASMKSLVVPSQAKLVTAAATFSSCAVMATNNVMDLKDEPKSKLSLGYKVMSLGLNCLYLVACSYTLLELKEETIFEQRLLTLLNNTFYAKIAIDVASAIWNRLS